MFKILLAKIGGSIGKFFGGGLISSLGSFGGGLLGRYLDKDDKAIMHHQQQIGFLLNDHNARAKLIENIAINFVAGKTKVQGELIWSTNIAEKVTYNEIYEETRKIQQSIISHSACFAVAIAAGKISKINFMFINGIQHQLQDYNYKIYYGASDQLPDQLIIDDVTLEKTPGFRNISYILFKDFNLDKWNGKIPHFSFDIDSPLPSKQQTLESVEKKRSQSELTNLSLEDNSKFSNVSCLIMGPGSGEYIYDPVPQYKKYTEAGVSKVEYLNISSKNHQDQKQISTCALESLDNALKNFPNLNWIAPTCCWFINGTEIEGSSILPGVEYRKEKMSFSNEWQVGKYDRESAYLISSNDYGSVNYGGTPTDESVIRYIELLKSKKLNILFYPLLMVDEKDKPWRGSISGNPEAIESFFKSPEGYNSFILHYAKLLAGKVDAFIIGSEMKSLTALNNGQTAKRVYPAVDQLINLAIEVKKIMGKNTLITYAADWSEYHHTKDGWYHMDKLWASDSIDFVGIDAYFPLTNIAEGEIKSSEIYQGWESGEHYDYHIKNDKKYNLDSKYAIKNIEYWWRNEHIQPNGSKSMWKAKSKKIWFTEYGFPSVDKSTNQPNVFYDPESREGGFPKFSKGEVDFSIQRRAIAATEDFWCNSTFLANKFLWCYDVRPFPSFPFYKIWADSNLWAFGHYVNGKSNFSPLASIIKKITTQAGISEHNIDVSEIDDEFQGININFSASALEILNMLRILHNFEIVEKGDTLTFHCSNHTTIICSFEANYFGNIKNNSKNHISGNHQIETIDDDKSLNNVICGFYDVNNRLEASMVSWRSDKNEHLKKSIFMRLPLTANQEFIFERLTTLAEHSAKANKVISFTLPLTAHILRPSDYIYLKLLDKNELFRISQMHISAGAIKFYAVSA